jgi:hypothetical protein
MQGCGLSIREESEDLLNKYADDMVNYCTTGLDRSIQDTRYDTPASKINLIDKKEQEVVQSKIDSLRSELFAYREKHIAPDISHVKGLHEQEDRKYLKLFWFMVIIYVTKLLITTV